MKLISQAANIQYYLLLQYKQVYKYHPLAIYNQKNNIKMIKSKFVRPKGSILVFEHYNTIIILRPYKHYNRMLVPTRQRNSRGSKSASWPNQGVQESHPRAALIADLWFEPLGNSEVRCRNTLD